MRSFRLQSLLISEAAAFSGRARPGALIKVNAVACKNSVFVSKFS